jgi:glutaredoxin-related protein
MSLVNAESTISSSNNTKTCMYLFYLEGCPHCANLDAYIQTIQNNYSLDIKQTSANEYPELFLNLSKYYNISKTDWGKVPAVFLGDYYCIGDTPCISTLETQIKKYQTTGVACVNPNEKKSVQISLKEITGLALVDAINPCELAVLILILTTILLKYPEQRKKVLFSGLSFSLAIFLGYLFFGFIIILGFKSLSNISAISSLIIRRFLGGVAILLGLLNIKDFFFYKQGSFATEMPLAWRPRMKKLIEGATGPKGVFIIGVLITIFLVPCTSGPYFIAGGILANLSWMSALPWLIYYNLLFVLPMLIITLIVYSGLVQVERVSNWRERNIKKLHLIAGIIMILIGIQIIFGIL